MKRPGMYHAAEKELAELRKLAVKLANKADELRRVICEQPWPTPPADRDEWFKHYGPPDWPVPVDVQKGNDYVKPQDDLQERISYTWGLQWDGCNRAARRWMLDRMAELAPLVDEMAARGEAFVAFKSARCKALRPFDRKEWKPGMFDAEKWNEALKDWRAAMLDLDFITRFPYVLIPVVAADDFASQFLEEVMVEGGFTRLLNEGAWLSFYDNYETLKKAVLEWIIGAVKEAAEKTERMAAAGFDEFAPGTLTSKFTLNPPPDNGPRKLG